MRSSLTLDDVGASILEEWNSDDVECANAEKSLSVGVGLFLSRFFVSVLLSAVQLSPAVALFFISLLILIEWAVCKQRNTDVQAITGRFCQLRVEKWHGSIGTQRSRPCF